MSDYDAVFIRVRKALERLEPILPVLEEIVARHRAGTLAPITRVYGSGGAAGEGVAGGSTRGTGGSVVKSSGEGGGGGVAEGPSGGKGASGGSGRTPGGGS